MIFFIWYFSYDIFYIIFFKKFPRISSKKSIVLSATFSWTRKSFFFFASGKSTPIRRTSFREAVVARHHGALVAAPLKPLEHHDSMAPRGLKGAFNWAYMIARDASLSIMGFCFSVIFAVTVSIERDGLFRAVLEANDPRNNGGQLRASLKLGTLLPWCSP